MSLLCVFLATRMSPGDELLGTASTCKRRLGDKGKGRRREGGGKMREDGGGEG